MSFATPFTPDGKPTAFLAADRWYSQFTVPVRVTQPWATATWISPATQTCHLSEPRAASAISASVRACGPLSFPVISSATPLTPPTRRTAFSTAHLSA